MKIIAANYWQRSSEHVKCQVIPVSFKARLWPWAAIPRTHPGGVHVCVYARILQPTAPTIGTEKDRRLLQVVSTANPSQLC